MDVRKIKLKNGATVLYSQKQSYFTYAKYHFLVGSNDETENIYGCAHLLEHMMFNGTKKYPKGKIEEIIEECGGDINACTSEHYTRYYGNVTQDDTVKLFQVLSDMCFNPLLNEEDFDTEKKIVIQELYDRNDDVWNHSFDSYFSKCFGSSAIVGTVGSVTSMKYDDFLDFHKKYYNFNNLIISIVTPIDYDTIIGMLDSVFVEYGIEGVKNENKYIIKDITTNVNEVSDSLDQVKLLTGFLIPKGFDDLTELYTQILGGGMTSRLYKNIREDKKLCYQIFSYSYDIGEKDYIGIGISFNELDKLEEILYNCNMEINAMNKVTNEEFERAKKVNFSSLCKIDEDNSKFVDALINRYEHSMPLSTDERISQLKDISLEDFQDFVEKYCVNQQLYTYSLHGDKVRVVK